MGENNNKNNKKVGAGLHLLIVDDSGLSRKMLARVLCAAGYTCDSAENGQVALDKLRINMTNAALSGTGGAGVGGTRLYDAVLTDYEMPVMNGPTSVKAMRLMGYKNKIFGLTGNGLAEQVPEGHDMT